MQPYKIEHFYFPLWSSDSQLAYKCEIRKRSYLTAEKRFGNAMLASSAILTDGLQPSVSPMFMSETYLSRQLEQA